MRISELLGASVVDEDGRHVGLVHDLRISLPEDISSADRRFEVRGLVVGPSGPLAHAAHAWGYAEGRAQAPLALKLLTRKAVRDSRVVPAGLVRDWSPPELRISGSADRLEPLQEARSR